MNKPWYVCPDDMVELNDSRCILNFENAYLGTFNCGCYNDLLITIIEDGGRVSLYEGSGNHSTGFQKDADGIYTFFFTKNCTWNDIKTEFVRFEMEKIAEGQLWVTAKWTKHLNFEVVYECSALFID